MTFHVRAATYEGAVSESLRTADEAGIPATDLGAPTREAEGLWQVPVYEQAQRYYYDLVDDTRSGFYAIVDDGVDPPRYVTTLPPDDEERAAYATMLLNSGAIDLEEVDAAEVVHLTVRVACSRCEVLTFVGALDPDGRCTTCQP